MTPEQVAGLLTDRERQVLALIAQGKTNREAGAALGVTENTVQAHMLRMARKLGSRGRAGMVAIALRAGLVA